MRTLLLVRHAEPELRGVMLGRQDPPLSELGQRTAREALGDLAVPIVYTSPLRRAFETAQLMEHAGAVQVLEELAEVGLGAWDGLSWSEIEARDPDLAQRKLLDWFGVTPPGGEPWTALEKRLARALAHVRNGPFPAVIVAHLAVNAELARQISGVDPASFRQDYCQVATYALPDR
jgi:broad specificity phosphatase PhoE